MSKEDHIILRYMIGTVVEIAALVAATLAAIVGILEFIGWLIEWLAMNMPDWAIVPEFMLLFAISFAAMFPELFFKPKKRTIRGYRHTLYPSEVDAA